MRALRVYIFTDGASQRTYVFVAHVTVRCRALLHVHPTSHGTLVPCAPYQVAAWCEEVHWLRSALAARDSMGMCKSEREVCVALLFVVCYYHRIRSLPRAQSGRRRDEEAEPREDGRVQDDGRVFALRREVQRWRRADRLSVQDDLRLSVDAG